MGLTVKGQPMNAAQTSCANTLLGVGKGLGAGALACEACIFDAIYESSVGIDRGPNSGGYCGPLGGATSNGFVADASGDANMATSFYQGGKGFQGGGAIALARTHSDIAYIGSQVTAATPFNSQGYSTQYLSQGFPFSSAAAEAQAIVGAYGGGAIKGGVAGVGGTGTVVNGSSGSTYQFQIGGTSNPDEDYWTGINRLAQEVNWYLYSNGELLYYMDGEEMIAQTPALILDRLQDGARIKSLSGNYDNTAYQYVSAHKRKFRVQRKAKLVQVTSPTAVQLELFCGIDEIRAGDVITLSSFGMLDGPWIVGTCQRSVFSPSSTITLVPPIAPLSEAAAAGATGTSQNTKIGVPGSAGSSPSTALSGTLRSKVVQVALAAIARQASSHAFQYAEVRPYPASLAGPAPIVTDCSGFSILCYKGAGAPDPNGTNFDGSGFTGSLVQHGTSVTTPQPADLIFYNTVGINSHVAVYLGNGEIFNMGGPGEPIKETMHIAPIYAIKSYL